MTDRHSELEKKFAADHVSEAAFQIWCSNHQPMNGRWGAFPDVYYRNGDSVVRHRLLGKAGELTTKQRKSATDITDRIEVDLTFGDGITHADVEAFLTLTGWQRELTLVKNFSRVFHFKHGGATVSVALYEVQREGGADKRRFMEVEIEKGSDVTEERARDLLTTWAGCLAEDFDLDEPMTESLYELYTGRRYVTAA